jgi:hypothetical protein
MSTDLITHQQASTALTIDADQSSFSTQQVAVLRHLGVDGADEGDLDVFFHVVKRTQLDPFARQIYMIGRNTYDQRQDRWVTKQTIQTGIDGYRLIGRRAADRARVKISVSAPEWAHLDGTWRPVWVRDWGMPVAARVTITRDGEPFTGVGLFDEYKQTKRNGELTSMWAQRPAARVPPGPCRGLRRGRDAAGRPGTRRGSAGGRGRTASGDRHRTCRSPGA